MSTIYDATPIFAAVEAGRDISAADARLYAQHLVASERERCAAILRDYIEHDLRDVFAPSEAVYVGERMLEKITAST